MTTITIAEARSLAIAVLIEAEVDCAIAAAVVDGLVTNDRDGYSSHGLQRLPDYLTDIGAGRANPSAIPMIESIGPNVLVIDARRAFAAVVVPMMVDALRRCAKASGVAVASLRSAHHLGRLARIGEAACRGLSPIAVVGFCNFLGTGARMAPLAGSRARLCTNPMLIAIPAGESAPFILDMSATVVAEGRIRAAKIAGQPVPEGWLVDGDGGACLNPDALYRDPPAATMAPLGWPAAAHKGFGLGLAAELMVGALAGTGHVADPQPPGNGGLFIALDPETLGGSDAEARVDAILEAATGGARYPGCASATRGDAAPLADDATISLPGRLVRWLRRASGSPSATESSPLVFLSNLE